MKGYILVDNRVAASTDPLAIANAMPLIKKELNHLAATLDAESTDEQLEKHFNSINTWLGFWNSNIGVLSHASKLQAIADAKTIVSELNWPLDEPPVTQTPS